MPIYEYNCELCGHHCERIQKHDDPPPACPKCNHDDPPTMKRRVSLASFRLKGSGWAFDGYGSG